MVINLKFLSMFKELALNTRLYIRQVSSNNVMVFLTRVYTNIFGNLLQVQVASLNTTLQ